MNLKHKLTSLTGSKPLSNRELSLFFQQMSMLFSNGAKSYSECIEIMMLDTPDAYSRKILESLQYILEEDASFSTALKMSGVFPDYCIHMVEMGENCGKDAQVLTALSSYYERENQIRESIRSAVSYPLIMISMMFIVILVLITRVLPIFSQVFAQLGTSMNGFSASLLAMGTKLNVGSFVIILVLAVLAVLYFYAAETEKGHAAFTRLAGKFPLTKGLYEDIAAERFANGMDMVLHTAEPDIDEGLGLIAHLVDNDAVHAKILECQELYREGSGLPSALKQTAIFNQTYTELLRVAYDSGHDKEAWASIADHYADETDRRIHAAISLIEPVLIIVLSLVVGMILMSVILPLMGIMSSIG